MSRRLWAVEKCIEEGCDRSPLARSLCSMHYQRRRSRGEDLPPKVRKPLRGRRCVVPGCARDAVARQMCSGHTARARRYRLSAVELAEVDARATCDLCERPPQHIDHSHTDGRVRGVLCMPCNTAIGHMNDNPALLRRAADYLERSDSERA